MNVSDLLYRDAGDYDQEACLVCRDLVDPALPHIFIRDADISLDDRAAMVGLLHNHCEDKYIEDAERAGLQPPAE